MYNNIYVEYQIEFCCVYNIYVRYLRRFCVMCVLEVKWFDYGLAVFYSYYTLIYFCCSAILKEPVW